MTVKEQTMSKITKEQVYEYFKNMESWERERFVRQMNDDMYEDDSAKRKEQYLKNKERRQKQIEKQRQQGEEFKKIVKPGDIVVCRGTKDGLGLREVLEVRNGGITARKISRSMRGYWYRDSYITEHYWEKIREIRNDIVVQDK